MATNQFENMQEMANAPFGPNGQSKEDYAKQVEEMELAEQKALNEKEPTKARDEKTAGGIDQKMLQKTRS